MKSLVDVQVMVLVQAGGDGGGADHSAGAARGDGGGAYNGND